MNIFDIKYFQYLFKYAFRLLIADNMADPDADIGEQSQLSADQLQRVLVLLRRNGLKVSISGVIAELLSKFNVTSD